VILAGQILWELTNTQMLVEGVYDTHEDVDRISLVEGGDIGSYVIVITPDVKYDRVTLRMEIQTYYCDTGEAPRRRFLERFPPIAYLQHSHRLVSSGKTLKELNEEEEDYCEISLI
jgi:hypothetical protein